MEKYVVSYLYRGRLHEVEVPAQSRDKAERRAFWTLAHYLNADLDRLKAGFAGSRVGSLP